MKHVLSNNITSTAKQPIIKETLAHYDNQLTEVINAICRGSLINGNGILYGCVFNGNLTAPTISAGAVSINGEIYLCDAFSASSITNSIYGIITTTYLSGDPILFTDGNSYNVHQDKKIVWTDATTGDLLFNFDTPRLNSKLIHFDLDYTDIQVNTGTVSLTNATKKRLSHKENYYDNSISIDFNIEGLETSANTIAYFVINLSMLNKTIDTTKHPQSIGYFYNSNTPSSPSSGNVKQSLTRIQHTNSGGNQFLVIYPIYDAVNSFDTTGTDNITLSGQITLYF